MVNLESPEQNNNEDKEYQPEPFLRASWGRKNAAEKGEEDKETKGAGIWRSIELASGSDVLLRKIAGQIKKDILHYQSAIHAFKEARSEKETKGSIEEMELKYKNENRAHKRLVDDLNLLSRQFRQKGLSNQWREEIGLTDEEVGRWAENLQIL